MFSYEPVPEGLASFAPGAIEDIDDLPRCAQDVQPHTSNIATADIIAMQDTDEVRASFDDAPIQYGVFGGMGAGTFRVQHNDSAVSIGSDCGMNPNTADCLPTPNKIAILVTLLKQFAEQQRKREPCANTLATHPQGL